VGANQNIST